MALSQAELSLQMGATRAFILADAEDVQFTRYTRLSDGAGGWKYSAPVLIAPQLARLIPQGIGKINQSQGQDGKRANVEWVIMLEAGADIERYDHFVRGGQEWEINEVYYQPEYEAKGDVIRYA